MDQFIVKYNKFLETNPSNIEFEKFIYDGNNFYFLTFNDIPEKFKYIYNDAARVKNYVNNVSHIV